MVLAFEIARPPMYAGPGLCLFRNVTGVPCPTCGSTRAVLAISRGHFIEGYLMNPFLVVALLALLALAAARLIRRGRPQSEPSDTARRIAWGALILLFVANWVYLILVDR